MAQQQKSMQNTDSPEFEDHPNVSHFWELYGFLMDYEDEVEKRGLNKSLYHVQKYRIVCERKCKEKKNLW